MKTIRKTARMDAEQWRKLGHILIDRHQTFSAWVLEKIEEEARIEAARQGGTQWAPVDEVESRR